VPVYVEDLFSTSLFTGTGATLTITNGVNLSTNGGLVWIKSRSPNADNHRMFDTVRGVNYSLSSSNTTASSSLPSSLTAFNSNGFTLGTNSSVNPSTWDMVSWTFREQPKFFDIVTYTGNATDRTVAHNLGSVPGCIIVKDTNVGGNWFVYHRGATASPQNVELRLNSTASTNTNPTAWNNTAPTSTVFSLGTGSTNINGVTYIAYLFAHNAGGFGTTGTDNIISCGSFQTDGSGNVDVTLNYEPIWVLYKNSYGTSDWKIIDQPRGWAGKYNIYGSNGLANVLFPNLADVESQNSGSSGWPTATGFGIGQENANNIFVYIAIRRPMAVPTVGTSVFLPQTRTGTGSATSITGVGFTVDTVIGNSRQTASYGAPGVFADRLRGLQNILISSQTTAEDTSSSSITNFGVANGIGIGGNTAYSFNYSGGSYVNWFFRRASSFFDTVLYRGSNQFIGASGFYAQEITHNLTVAPEFMIIRTRDTGGYWYCYVAANGNNSDMFLDGNTAKRTGSIAFNNFTPTSTVFQVNSAAGLNSTTNNYIAYLFATAPGVSKVGTYSGSTGSAITVNCGFTTGVRFVFIKAVTRSGDWYIWNSATGISSGNDPFLTFNQLNNEVTNTNYIETTSAGFQVTSAAPVQLNATGETYLFLAIA
jgi:hypothetical protein